MIPVKQWMYIIGLGFLIIFWFIVRSCIKDGSIKTDNPRLFLLGKKYKDGD